MIVLPILLAQAGQYASPKSEYWLNLIQWILPLTPVIAFYIRIAFYILIAVCIWRAAKYFSSAVREQKLLRMEMGKLAEEVHLLRQEIKGDNKQASSHESG